MIEFFRKIIHKEVNDFWALTTVTLLFCIPLITIFFDNLKVIGFIWAAIGWYALISEKLKQLKITN
jgi:hypothetical protein